MVVGWAILPVPEVDNVTVAVLVFTGNTKTLGPLAEVNAVPPVAAPSMGSALSSGPQWVSKNHPPGLELTTAGLSIVKVALPVTNAALAVLGAINPVNTLNAKTPALANFKCLIFLSLTNFGYSYSPTPDRGYRPTGETI
jgi:hypothetical protein